MAKFTPEQLIGRTFLINQEDGQVHRARIVRQLKQHENQHKNSVEYQKYLVSINNDAYEDILSYNQILDYVNDLEDQDPTLWKFKRIVKHEGPLSAEHPNYNGSKYNVMIEWENGEIIADSADVASLPSLFWL